MDMANVVAALGGFMSGQREAGLEREDKRRWEAEMARQNELVNIQRQQVGIQREGLTVQREQLAQAATQHGEEMVLERSQLDEDTRYHNLTVDAQLYGLDLDALSKQDQIAISMVQLGLNYQQAEDLVVERMSGRELTIWAEQFGEGRADARQGVLLTANFKEAQATREHNSTLQLGLATIQQTHEDKRNDANNQAALMRSVVAEAGGTERQVIAGQTQTVAENIRARVEQGDFPGAIATAEDYAVAAKKYNSIEQAMSGARAVSPQSIPPPTTEIRQFLREAWASLTLEDKQEYNRQYVTDGVTTDLEGGIRYIMNHHWDLKMRDRAERLSPFLHRLGTMAAGAPLVPTPQGPSPVQFPGGYPTGGLLPGENMGGIIPPQPLAAAPAPAFNLPPPPMQTGGTAVGGYTERLNALLDDPRFAEYATMVGGQVMPKLSAPLQWKVDPVTGRYIPMSSRGGG